MPEPLIDVRRRIQHLERRRKVLWSTVDSCVATARVHQRAGRIAHSRVAALIAESSIAKAHAQCLTVEIYALRAMVGIGAQDVLP